MTDHPHPMTDLYRKSLLTQFKKGFPTLPQLEVWEEPNLHVEFGEIFDLDTACDIMEYLEKVVDYPPEPTIKIYGKEIRIPRLHVGYGDDGLQYKFSGTTIAAKKWDPIILAICQYLNQ